MRGLPLNRLHHPTRREVGRGAQEQVDMIRPHVALQNFDVLTSTNFPDQIPHTLADLPHQDRLAILGGEHEMVVQTINGVGGSTQFAHGRPSYRKPPEGFARRRGVSPIPDGDSNSIRKRTGALLAISKNVRSGCLAGAQKTYYDRIHTTPAMGTL